MSTEKGQPATADENTFMITPNLFFGNDVYFSPPQSYYDEVAEHEGRIREVREELAKAQDLSPEQVKSEIEWQERDAKSWPEQTLYERRFRGMRNISAELYGCYEPLKPIFEEGAQATEEDSDKVKSLLSLSLIEQQWDFAFLCSSKWHDALPEDSPNRQIAANYAGFCGNLVLTDFVRRAQAYVAPNFDQAEFVAVKHFVTIWWPLAEDLERFIPDEVALKKQAYRETSLEYEAHSMGGIRRYVDLLLYDDPYYRSLDFHHDSQEIKELERTAFTKFLRMENLDDEKRRTLLERFDRRVNQLVEDEAYSAALNLIDAGWRAFSLNPEELQDRITYIARQGVHRLTLDMSDYFGEEMPMFVQPDEDINTSLSKQYLVDEIIGSPGLTQEVIEELTELVSTRLTEHQLLKLTDKDGRINPATALELVRSLVASESPERIAKREQIEQIIEVHQTLPYLMSMRGNDGDFSNFLSLLSRLPEYEQRIPEILSTMFDIFSEAIDDMGPYDEPFEVFLAFVSPILNKSDKTENPNDEYLLSVIGKRDICNAVDKMIEHSVRHTQTGKMNKYTYIGNMRLFSSLKPAIDTDLRQWWDDYWNVRGIY